MDIAIAATGLVTALGRTVDATWDGILAGRTIKGHTVVDARPGLMLSRVSALGCEAAEQAVAAAGWSDGESTILIACTSKGAILEYLTPPPTSDNGAAGGSGPAGVGSLDWDVARTLGWSDIRRSTISAACASGLIGLIHGASALKAGLARRALVVAAEASIHPLFLATFDRLGVLADPLTGCRPFDISRSGFFMSEAAAAVCLEVDSPRRLASVEGYGFGGDGSHLTASDGRLLGRLLGGTFGHLPVDLIHAHGTGTSSNDRIELAAIESTGFVSRPSLFSHKAAVGHTLGAAGLVGIVLSVEMHRRGVVLPNAATTRPMESDAVRIERTPMTRSIRRSITVAAGFGGATAVVGIRKE